jgi:hypothetical protein
VRYQIIAEAYRDLEGSTARLELIDRLAGLVRQTPEGLLPTVALLCQGQIAPDFAGVELGLNERLAARAVATAAGVPPEQVLATARETGDLGLTAERLLGEPAVTRRGLPQWNSSKAKCSRWRSGPVPAGGRCWPPPATTRCGCGTRPPAPPSATRCWATATG